MEIGKQIRKYRTELKLSQDDLADKVYVTRQTISNWENDRNYPDVRSLVLLSNVFGVSLDILIKGRTRVGSKIPYRLVEVQRPRSQWCRNPCVCSNAYWYDRIANAFGTVSESMGNRHLACLGWNINLVVTSHSKIPERSRYSHI